MSVLRFYLLIACGALVSSSPALADGLIWSDLLTGQILRGPADGSEPAVVLFEALDYPGLPSTVAPAGLAVDGKFVYWTDAVTHQILRGNIDGTGPATLLYDVDDYPGEPTSFFPEGIDVQGEVILWADGLAGQVLSGSSDGSTPATTLFDFSDSPANPYLADVSISDDLVYFSDTANGNILVGPIDGEGSATSRLQPSGSPAGLEVENGIAYWADADGAIVLANADGSGAIQVPYVISDYPDVPNAIFPYDVAVDNDALYWTDQLTRSILGGSTDGAATVTTLFDISNYPGSPSEIAPFYVVVLKDNADFDTDNDVDGADFLAWQRGFGSDAGVNNIALTEDGNANSDQFVNADDLVVWQDQYGDIITPLSASATVPEPTTASLSLLAILISCHLLCRRVNFLTMHVTSHTLVVLLATVLCTVIESRTVVAQYRIETIALLGDIAPGSGGSGVDVPFTSLGFPIINDSGELAFTSATSPNADGASQGIFSTVGGMLQAVAFQQQLAAGSGGSGADVPFEVIFSPLLNDAGVVAFSANTLPNADGGDSGIFSTQGGTLQSVVFENQIAPGSGGSGTDVAFSDSAIVTFYPVSLSPSGEVTFGGITETNSDGRSTGIFSTVGGSLHSVVFAGEIAPGSGGSGPDVRLRSIEFPSVNAAGEVVFSGTTETNADGGNSGIFSTVGGTLTTVAFEQLLAPGSGGSGADVPFSHLLRPAQLNDSGEVVISGFTAPNIDGDTFGVFSNVDGTLHSVTFSGQIMPGSGGSGADVPLRFSIFEDINSSGEILFQGITSPNAEGGNIGIFSDIGGSLKNIVFSQQLAPGSGGSGSDVPFESFGRPAWNAAGDIAFSASTSPNVDGGLHGIFTHVGGALHAVVFEGDQIEVASGDNRIISRLSFSPLSRSGSQRVLNDSGQLVFTAQFDDGSSGIFVATLVPEPSAAMLLCISGFVSLAGYRRLPAFYRKA